MYNLVGSNIIFLASTLTALYTIYKLLKQLIQTDQKMRDKQFEDNFNRYYIKASNETKEEFKKELLEDISCKLEDIGFKLGSIDETNIKQTEIIIALEKSARDTIKTQIENIYFSNKKTKVLTGIEKEMLELLYKDYVAHNGNSYIKKIYNIMSKWKIEETEEI